MANKNWVQKVQQYCTKYNIPIDYLHEIINDPKVIPMIRGKAFEFSVYLRLQTILSATTWEVIKPVMNAQIGMHDMDVKIRHLATNRVFSIECKLSGKGSFKVLRNRNFQFKVKCMRSRTLGESKVKELAPKLGVTENLLQVHNDQYLPTDFDFVITSLANAFYETDEESDIFEWQLTAEAIRFLQYISGNITVENLQDFAYHKMYIAKAQNLAVKQENSILCTRRSCPQPQNCGFIPNYPLITFEQNTRIPNAPWIEIEQCEKLLNSLVNT